MLIGLTGGMGCGKSTAARIWADHGFQLLDSDALIRDELFTRPALRAALADRFGPEVLARDGSVDRAQLGARVFGHEAELAALEALVHPPLYALWRERLAAGGPHPWVCEVPLLFEKGLEIWFDHIVCVASGSAAQLRRLELRGVSPAVAALRIAQQLPLSEKMSRSDAVLWNDGSRDFLAAQVARLVSRWSPA